MAGYGLTFFQSDTSSLSFNVLLPYMDTCLSKRTSLMCNNYVTLTFDQFFVKDGSYDLKSDGKPDLIIVIFF